LLVGEDSKGTFEPSAHRSIASAKALALTQLAYGYTCRVIDQVSGEQVFPLAPERLSA
jgi:hypothetical protein